jgi:hypothetical protein
LEQRRLIGLVSIGIGSELVDSQLLVVREHSVLGSSRLLEGIAIPDFPKYVDSLGALFEIDPFPISEQTGQGDVEFGRLTGANMETDMRKSSGGGLRGFRSGKS